MYSEQKIIELKKYLHKLYNFIEREALFSFISTKLFDKKKVDDLICCIDASFPEEYKNYIRETQKSLRTTKSYRELLNAIQNKFMFNTNMYLVHYQEALAKIVELQQVIDSDIKLINNQQAGTY
jgi:hypothetical protein